MTVSSSILATVLAAGRSRRFGGDKRLYELDNTPLLQHVLAKPLSLGLQTLLVLKPEDELILDQLLGPWQGSDRLSILYSARAHQGMGCSLADAAAYANSGGYQGMLVMLADMPHIEPRTLKMLVRAHVPKGICVPTVNGESGHPVLFARHWFKDLARLQGDQGAKGIIEANPDYVHDVAVKDKGILEDIDHRPRGILQGISD